MKEFWLCFVPLFVAVDAIGVLPMFISLIEGVEHKRLNLIILQSVITAIGVAVVFLLIGPALLNLLSITVADFMVAGGLLLFIIAISDLLSSEKKQRKVDPETLGAVPIGVPLITGPGVLTTSILLMNQHGITATAISIIVNVFIAGIIFYFADFLTKILGHAGTKIISKIASILLTAIAIMMIRKGIFLIINMRL
ncbi:MAG: MarC family protein [Desulfobacterales bacterium]|nr:MarC family protein [Desulfobacterales bacterium]